MATPNTTQKSCPGGCSMCTPGGTADDPGVQSPGGQDGGSGLLVLRSACAFGVPLVGSLAGAVWAGGGEIRRVAGMAIGLVVGLVGGVLLSRLVRRVAARRRL